MLCRAKHSFYHVLLHVFQNYSVQGKETFQLLQVCFTVFFLFVFLVLVVHISLSLMRQHYQLFFCKSNFGVD